MRTPETIVAEWYSGEVGGAALFALLASRAEPAEASKWHALESVEQHTARYLAQILDARGVPLPDISHTQNRAHERCEALRDQSWASHMQWLYRIAEVALQKMRSDAALLPAELESAGNMIVAHEVMLVQFAALELAALEASRYDTPRAAADSLQLVQEFLAHDALGQQGRQICRN